MIALIALMAGGIGLRLINLTNPPLDFHADRQLRGAIIARGMYYQMLDNVDTTQQQIAIKLWKNLVEYEPPILERIVAITYYLTGGEHLWIARLYTTLFWVIGGITLYALTSRLTSRGAALFSLAFYLFSPFSVTASRSFQPDPFMVMWIILAMYCLYRWAEEQSWKWAVLTAVCVGIAAVVKIFAAVMLAPALCIVVLNTNKGKKFLQNKQVWLMAAICIMIPASYYLLSIGARSASFFSFWTVSYWYLILKLRFYLSWLDTAGSVIGKSTIFFSLAGGLLLSSKGRQLAAGLWLGYGIYGLLVPYQISTHDYYSLALIPLAALSLAPVWDLIYKQICQQKRVWQVLFAGIVIVYLGFQSLLIRNALVSSDMHNEIKGWEQMGAEMPRDGSIIALTHDYGLRIAYYGMIEVATWPYTGDFQLLAMRESNQGNSQNQEGEFKQYFASMIRGHRYFLVTQFGELKAQPLLKAMLYDHYPIARQGGGYVLFDLAQPLSP
jgi:4-amino-4-deoxy-L-arabinose transferase-like glycosyltransferase